MNSFGDFNDYNFLCHHGIKGMKWGVRRYQNPDGTLTDAGRKKYGKKVHKYAEAEIERYNKLAKKAKKKGDEENYNKNVDLAIKSRGLTEDDWFKEMQQVKEAGKKYGKWALLGGPLLATTIAAINAPKEIDKIRKGREAIMDKIQKETTETAKRQQKQQRNSSNNFEDVAKQYAKEYFEDDSEFEIGHVSEPTYYYKNGKAVSATQTFYIKNKGWVTIEYDPKTKKIYNKLLDT